MNLVRNIVFASAAEFVLQGGGEGDSANGGVVSVQVTDALYCFICFPRPENSNHVGKRAFVTAQGSDGHFRVV